MKLWSDYNNKGLREKRSHLKKGRCWPEEQLMFAQVYEQKSDIVILEKKKKIERAEQQIRRYMILWQVITSWELECH